MERIELGDGLRIDARGAGIIVRQADDGEIELTVVQEGAPTATLRVPIEQD